MRKWEAATRELRNMRLSDNYKRVSTMKVTKYSLGVLLGMSLAASLASAQDFYASVNFGRSDFDFGVSGIDDDDSNISFAGGVKMNDNLALELGYIDFGDISVSGNGTASVEADAIQLSLLGLLPVSDAFGLVGRLGVDMWDATVKYSNVPGFGTGKVSDDGSDLFYGIGAYVNLGANANVHFDWQFHELDDVDIDTMSLGLSFYF